MSSYLFGKRVVVARSERVAMTDIVVGWWRHDGLHSSETGSSCCDLISMIWYRKQAGWKVGDTSQDYKQEEAEVVLVCLFVCLFQ